MDERGRFDHQNTLVRLLHEMHLELGPVSMVEVGVASGRTSEILLQECPFLYLTMVDHWTAPRNHPTRTQEWYDVAFQTAKQRTEFAHNRRNQMRMSSVNAGWTFHSIYQVARFDLVFIDAHHGFESVLTDCVAWWPNVKTRGIFCGHDIDGKKDRPDGPWGVRRAVEWFSQNIVKLPFQVEKNMWIMRKENQG